MTSCSVFLSLSSKDIMLSTGKLALCDRFFNRSADAVDAWRLYLRHSLHDLNIYGQRRNSRNCLIYCICGSPQLIPLWSDSDAFSHYSVPSHPALFCLPKSLFSSHPFLEILSLHILSSAITLFECSFELKLIGDIH